ncbi:MAG: hypothetical protein SOV57_07395 [Bacilli bacterium]|nr:hypothetical protein [Bacilli bacterium]
MIIVLSDISTFAPWTAVDMVEDDANVYLSTNYVFGVQGTMS